MGVIFGYVLSFLIDSVALAISVDLYKKRKDWIYLVTMVLSLISIVLHVIRYAHML